MLIVDAALRDPGTAVIVLRQRVGTRGETSEEQVGGAVVGDGARAVDRRGGACY